MYESFYGLKERPFTLVPDPDFLYLSPQHKLARAYLEYGLTQRLGFIVLTGEVGTGKTTIIKALLKGADRKLRLGVIYQTSFDATDLLELLLREFGLKGHFSTRVARLAAFNKFLINAYANGEHVVLIVDEAQNLGPEALEELRLLSNLQADKEPLLQVILVGQPALQERLRHPSLAQLAQRVSVHYHLLPLDLKDTKEYVNFRLARAGGSGIFTDGALELLYQHTKGVPRRINTLCDLALVAGFAEGRREIDEEFLTTVLTAQGLGLESQESAGAALPEPLTPTSPTPAPAAAPLTSADGLGLAVAELSARLSRLEGLVLDLTHQMVPVLHRLLDSKEVSESAAIGGNETGARQLAETERMAEDQAQTASASLTGLAKPRRRWWTIFREYF